MSLSEFCLLCFFLGTLWALVSMLLGGMHFGHGLPGHGVQGHGHSHSAAHGHHLPNWLSSLLSPSVLAVFLAWFGGIGYLLNKYSGFLLWINLLIAVIFGLAGAWILARFLSWLMRNERVMNPSDYEMVGVLGHVSSTIRADGVGEVIYLHEGVRRSLCAKSETGALISRGEEVIVTHFEKGIALVRTWEAMTQQAGENQPQRIA